MPHPLDPTVCHPGECEGCGRYMHDRDNLDDNGECWECAEERAERIRQEEEDDDA